MSIATGHIDPLPLEMLLLNAAYDAGGAVNMEDLRRAFPGTSPRQLRRPRISNSCSATCIRLTWRAPFA